MTEIVVEDMSDGCKRIIISGEKFRVPLEINVEETARGEGMINIMSTEYGRDLLVVPVGGDSESNPDSMRGIREVRIIVRPED